MTNSIGYIGADGIYHKGEKSPRTVDVSITHKEWRHDLERKQFAKEILQPVIGGKPNRDFVVAYPEESKQYFSDEEIERIIRTL